MKAAMKAILIVLFFGYLLVVGTIAYHDAKSVVEVANARVAATEATLNE